LKLDEKRVESVAGKGFIMFKQNVKRRFVGSVLALLVAAGMPAFCQEAEIDAAEKQVKAAQEKSDWAAVVQNGVAEAGLIAKALTGEKPNNKTDAVWNNTLERWKAQRLQAEYACFDATTHETDPAKKVKLLEQFLAAFEGGDYAKRSLVTLAGAYQQTGDKTKALATAKRVLEVEPDNEAMHLMLADNDLNAKQLPSAIEHARAAIKAIESKKKPEGYADDAWSTYTKTISGTAHSIAGQALMLQDKPEAAIADLKPAVDMLAGNNQLAAPAMYNLAFAYGKLKRMVEARAVLAKLLPIPGPYQQLAKDLAAKVK
jgi:tetratricopeptide (TPR) repeat protein